jgi:hypothetical protein
MTFGVLQPITLPGYCKSGSNPPGRSSKDQVKRTKTNNGFAHVLEGDIEIDNELLCQLDGYRFGRAGVDAPSPNEAGRPIELMYLIRQGIEQQDFIVEFVHDDSR